jgi:DNA-directed RNA polymerase II subunit RPB2
MTYGTTIHYDVDVDLIYYENDIKKETTITLEKIYLGRFPIMLQSNLCILKSLTPEVRFNMGECRNDYGGYFIIDGKEKVILCQEKFANNMLYVRKNKADDIYSYSAEIRSVSEDASKPMRTTSVKMVATSSKYSNQQLVVDIPNVKKPIPLFIVMRALGVVSDKQIIETCLLDMDKYSSYIDLFIPSIHDANIIFNQETALEYISTFIKRETIDSTLEILTDYFLPHIGEKNFLDKAYFIGIMVHKLLKVYMNEEKPTDRDSFLFKRVEVTGSLLYDLFREYFLIQNREIAQKIDKENYFNPQYKNNFISLIEDNYVKFFKERTVETGFKKAFKGNWGASSNTKKLGVVQDLNRLSWYTFISHLRKIILPLDASAKVVGPRHLNSSQWGFIDPVDTPDGAHIGLHKHLSISTIITSGSSGQPMIEWLRYNTSLKLLQECNPSYLGKATKMFVNGKWIGAIENPIVVQKTLKLLRRNGVIPLYTSISFDYTRNEMNIYTDSGRLMRPIYFLEDKKGKEGNVAKTPSFNRSEVIELFKKGEITWNQITSGFKEKKDKNFSYKENKVYYIQELYPELEPLNLILREKEGVSLEEGFREMEKILLPKQSIIDYIDTSEEETALIAMKLEDLTKNKLYTNLEIDPSLIFGVMGNSIIFPEHNQFPRDVFSCGQSRQAVSVYHSNYQMRIDKMGVILNYGEVPLIKSRYLKYINKEEQPYGINAIVAIMSYTGYNVEDAILINAGSVARGIFNTSYYTMYESREESAKISGNSSNSVFTNIAESSKKNSRYKTRL